jgi:predicted RNase H-like nuclease
MPQHVSSNCATCIIGFDSAWSDRMPGAVCSITVGKDGAVSFKRPISAHFDGALVFINGERSMCDTCLVALDQPTIVPNETGGRPVDKVAGSVIGFIGGGAQMASRSRVGFGNGAPIWQFKTELGAIENPEVGRKAERGLFIIEVFPALALPAFNTRFYGRYTAPKYNPANKKTFRRSDWLDVIETIAQFGRAVPIEGIEDWTRDTAGIETPRKVDHDRLDAVLCALIGYHWRAEPRHDSIMIGDLIHGYMISPTTADISERLRAKAAGGGVPVDGKDALT